MKYFVELEEDKSKRIGITNLLSNITQKDHSHKGGWTKLLKCQLTNAGYSNVTILTNGDSLERYDVVIFDLGAEFSGTINLFGGLDEKCYKRIVELINFNGNLYSWHHQVPNLKELVKSRLSNKSTFEGFKIDFDVDTLDKSITVFKHVEHKKHLLIGDSHTPSVWSPDMMIDRGDGRTLHGTLKKEVIADLVESYKPEKLTLYCGNIDIRHHVCRFDDPHRAAAELAIELRNQLPLGIEIELIQPLPIESEERKLPKTGYYQGTPFFGSWFERNSTRTTLSISMENICEEEKWSFFRWPDYFYSEQHQLDFDCMERPQSIHLSPMHYRWDLNNNVRRF